MNERLEKEIDRYEEENHGFESSSRYDCICIAKHFYNFALEEVKIEVEEHKEKYVNDSYISTHSCGELDSYDEVLDFIDQLRK